MGLQAVPLIHMGDMSDVGRRTGTLFSILAISALAGPPISGAIASATGNYKAVGYYAGARAIPRPKYSVHEFMTVPQVPP